MTDFSTVDFSTVDYFTDPSLLVDPYEYLDYLRSQCPIHREPHHDVLAVTGYDEAAAIYRDDDSFSSCNVVGGPFPGLPVEPEGDDITELIEQYRHVFPLSENFTTFDPPEHTKLRTLLMRLITPRRMRDNEDFMWRLGQRLMDGFAEGGRADFVNDFAHPFSLLVIADFLGVPEEDHEWFKDGFQSPKPLGSIDGETYQGGHLAFLEDSFTHYIEDRRREPRDDALSKLALARYPDGSLPEVVDVVRMAAMLFAAGKGTAVHLFAMTTLFLAEHPELQEQLRQQRELLPSFIEETLRLESPNKVVFRLARKTTSVGGIDIPAGSTMMLMNSAVNRDPRRFERPSELRIDRPNPMEHLAFGRGTHACPGGPLARAEARVVLNLVLDRMGDIRISEDHHGPAGQRQFRYQPSFFSRMLEELHIEFTPIG